MREIRLRAPLLVLSHLGPELLHSRRRVYTAALVLPPETKCPTHLSAVPRSHIAPFFGNNSQRARADANIPPPSPKAPSPTQAQRPRPAPGRAAPLLTELSDRPRASRVLASDCVAQFDATYYVTSAPSREAALSRWQAPGGSRSSTTEDGDERRRRGGGSSAGTRGSGDRGRHDPGLGGGGAAPAVRVLFRL